MKILICVEFYFPSVGGAQEVCRQLAKQFVSMGHIVHIATTKIDSRKDRCDEGILIHEFRISGNNAYGLRGDVIGYRKFLINSEYDIFLIYAAQQWTFDAMWPILDGITAKKVLVPCGYSGIFNPIFRDYFQELSGVLKKFDWIVYHANDYRDVNFSKEHDISNGSLIPNGALISEFNGISRGTFRGKNSIEADEILLITIGSLNGSKGHLELAKAYQLLDFEKKSMLILNGSPQEKPLSIKGDNDIGAVVLAKISLLITMAKNTPIRQLISKFPGLMINILGLEKLYLRMIGRNVDKNLEEELNKISNEVYVSSKGNKKILITNLDRYDLITALIDSDLFVFASHIEYSPLVLYEASAAKLPFLSVSVGNASEIAEWTGGGIVMQVKKDSEGLTKVLPSDLAIKLAQVLKDKTELIQLGINGNAAVNATFNWKNIAEMYLNIFKKISIPSAEERN